MIILIDAQAAKVRGVSPKNPNAALQPVPLKDGTWMLSETVLGDAAHADARDFLAALPTVKSIDPANLYDPDARPADAAAAAAKVAGNTYADAGARKPLAAGK